MKNLLLASQNLMKACVGLMFLFLLFIFCVVIVLGVKTSLFVFKEKFFAKKEPPKPIVKKHRKPINKIEINPNEDTRIVFKKTS